MDIRRTPDSRFDGLPDYPFPPNYVDVDEGHLRIHYVDAGPATGEPLLCLHGQPSWSYLYRKMIPILTGAGYRVIAPDLIGFGRSDKPAAAEDYSYARHVGWITAFVRALELDRITLIAQDWGGLIGLRVVAEDSQRFARIVLANTSLPDAEGVTPGRFGNVWRRRRRWPPTKWTARCVRVQMVWGSSSGSNTARSTRTSGSAKHYSSTPDGN
jgi:haloalkane dehalogenase